MCATEAATMRRGGYNILVNMVIDAGPDGRTLSK